MLPHDVYDHKIALMMMKLQTLSKLIDLNYRKQISFTKLDLKAPVFDQLGSFPSYIQNKHKFKSTARVFHGKLENESS